MFLVSPKGHGSYKSGLAENVGGYQNYGHFLGPLNIMCRIIIRSQKGTMILTTTHIVPTKNPRLARNVAVLCIVLTAAHRCSGSNVRPFLYNHSCWQLCTHCGASENELAVEGKQSEENQYKSSYIHVQNLLEPTVDRPQLSPITLVSTYNPCLLTLDIH